MRDRRQTRQRLLEGQPHICPSLLNSDFGHLAAEIAVAQQCGVPAIHWDAMDGHFVPNFTFGPPLIAALRDQSDLLFDAHLMLARPEGQIDAFLQAGCDIITIHLEVVPEPKLLLDHIRAGGALAGLSINPPTPVETLAPWLEYADLILIMSVMPGYGGQAFDPVALEKLRWVKQHACPETIIEVDGGVNTTTAASVVEAGAGLLVIGSAFYGASDRPAAFQALAAATQVRGPTGPPTSSEGR